MPDIESPPSPIHSFDAQLWAESFVAHVKLKPSIATDPETMLAWFSSALMRGYDEAVTRGWQVEGGL
jgi:hypothetical protein